MQEASGREDAIGTKGKANTIVNAPLLELEALISVPPRSWE